VCDLETSRMGAPYIYDISRLRVKEDLHCCTVLHVVSCHASLNDGDTF